MMVGRSGKVTGHMLIKKLVPGGRKEIFAVGRDTD
jgi:hypothetical protein